jgi:hypothetical protein
MKAKLLFSLFITLVTLNVVITKAHAENFEVRNAYICAYADMDDEDADAEEEFDTSDFGFLFTAEYSFIGGLTNGAEGIDVDGTALTDPDGGALDGLDSLGDLGDEDIPVSISYGSPRFGLALDYQIDDSFLEDSYDEVEDTFSFNFSIRGSFKKIFDREIDLPLLSVGSCYFFEDKDSDPEVIDLSQMQINFKTFATAWLIGLPVPIGDDDDSENDGGAGSASQAEEFSAAIDEAIANGCALVTGKTNHSQGNAMAVLFFLASTALLSLKFRTRRQTY